MTEITTVKAATAIAGSLGYPSKMPGTSYGIPASACKTGRKLAAIEGTQCSLCYAFERGNYRFESVKASQAKRLDGINSPDWVASMVLLLQRAHATGKHAPYHRWHDSGDIQSVEHLGKICEVARLTPELRHWLPTREMTMVKAFVKAGGALPDNLVVRVSATMIDGAAPRAWPLTSTVVSHDGKPEGHQCPARGQGNVCGACRACWSRDVPNVAYPVH